MKLRFLKMYKAGDTTCEVGKTYVIDDSTEVGKALVTKLLADQVAEKSVDDPGTNGPDVITLVKQVLASDEFTKGVAERVRVSVKDKSDDDPSHGYYPEANGRELTKAEKVVALGRFAKDVVSAGEGFSRPSELLTKSISRSQGVIDKAVKDGVIDKAAGSGVTVAIDAEAGALLPPVLSIMLSDVGMEVSPIRKRAKIVPVGLGGVEIVKPKNYDHSSGTIYGGVKAYWIAEDDEITATKPKTETLQLRVNGLAAMAYASHKTMKGAPASYIGGYVLPVMAEGIAFAETDAFINGNGAGKPMGLMNAGCKLSITAETGQTSTANVILTANIDKMVARIRVKNNSGLTWLYNRPELYTWLIGLTRVVGTGGQMANLFQRGSPAANTGAVLDGIPIEDTEFCQAAATTGDLILTDLSQYLVADDQSGAEVAQSIHLKFDYGQSAFRIIKYVGGMPENSAVFQRYKGSNTTSSIVTLATRS